jgi:hypothetical protein
MKSYWHLVNLIAWQNNGLWPTIHPICKTCRAVYCSVHNSEFTYIGNDLVDNVRPTANFVCYVHNLHCHQLDLLSGYEMKLWITAQIRAKATLDIHFEQNKKQNIEAAKTFGAKNSYVYAIAYLLLLLTKIFCIKQAVHKMSFSNNERQGQYTSRLLSSDPITRVFCASIGQLGQA